MKFLLVLCTLFVGVADLSAQMTAYRKTAQRHDDFSNNTWQGKDSIVFQYNNAAELTNMLCLKGNLMNWDNWYRFTYSLNGAGQTTQQLREDWNGSMWVNTNHYLYTYDSMGNNTEILYETWNGNSWNPAGKITYSGYNADGKYQDEYVFSYNGGWVNQSWRKRSYLNNQTLITEDDRYLWIGGNWKKYDRNYYTYTQQEVSSITHSTADANDQWQARDKYLYQYTFAPVLLQEYIAQEMDTLTMTWKNISRLSHSYTPTNKLFETQHDLYANNNWQQVSREQFIYNGSDELIEKYSENMVGANWVKDMRSTFSYQNNLATEELRYLAPNNQWELNKKLSFQYNAQDSLIFEQEEEYLAGSFIPLSRDFYYYQAFTVTGLANNEMNTMDMLLYPNPAQGELHVECPANGLLLISISDMSGRILLQRSQQGSLPIDISLGGLQAGTYHLQCKDMESGKRGGKTFILR